MRPPGNYVSWSCIGSILLSATRLASNKRSPSRKGRHVRQDTHAVFTRLYRGDHQLSGGIPTQSSGLDGRAPTRQIVVRLLKSDRLPVRRQDIMIMIKRLPSQSALGFKVMDDCKLPIDVRGRCFANLSVESKSHRQSLESFRNTLSGHRRGQMAAHDAELT